MSEYGYAGEILKINLTDNSVEKLNTFEYSNRFLGGRGIGAKLYWDETSSETKAMEPENPIICTTGPIACFAGFAGCRWHMCGKSSGTEPESFSYANFGGSWGSWLKYAGFDGIVIKGKSGNPSWILIQDDRVEIRDASHLRGKTTDYTEDYFKETLGRNARVMCVGPAGENLVSFSTVMASDSSSGSGGFGSIFGSKNLKAVVIDIKIKKIPGASDPETLKKLAKDVYRLRTENYENYGHVELDKKRLRACYGCISGCDRQELPDETGRNYKHFCQSSAVYIEHAIKFNGLEKGMEINRMANRLCDQHGLDTAVMMPLIDWLSICYEAGIIDEDESGLPLSKIGSAEFIQVLIEKICSRKGFGDILAKGTIKAAKFLGKNSERFISSVIGTPANETRDYDPRYMMVNSLIYPFEPRRPIQLLHATSLVIARWQNNIDGFDDAFISPIKFERIAKEFWGSIEAADFGTCEGKALAAKRIQDYGYVKESLVICDLSWPIYPARCEIEGLGFSTLESLILSAVTGKNVTEDILTRIGERIFNLQRAIMIRQGSRGRKDDTIMEFYHSEPLGSMFKNPECIAPGKDRKKISRKGAVLNKGDFEKLKDEYYSLRGWDVKTGFQTYKKLKELDMEDIAQELDKMELLR